MCGSGSQARRDCPPWPGGQAKGSVLTLCLSPTKNGIFFWRLNSQIWVQSLSRGPGKCWEGGYQQILEEPFISDCKNKVGVCGQILCPKGMGQQIVCWFGDPILFSQIEKGVRGGEDRRSECGGSGSHEQEVVRTLLEPGESAQFAGPR